MKKLPLFLIFICLIGLAACRQQNIPATENASIIIALASPEQPPQIGEDTLTITVTNAAGEPVSGASVRVAADMTHAGMTPETGTGRETEQAGVYAVPIRWTMGGDYFLTVTVTLPGGATAEQRFDWRVDA